MKNAMKKLTSLLLVALLLVGMIPFAASAVEPGNVSFAVKIGDSDTADFAKEGPISGESTTVANLLRYWYGSADASATFNVGGDAGSYKDLSLADLDSIIVTPGQHVVVRVKAAANTGNTGDTNSGNTNTGDTNSGNTNTGDTNSGNTNTGDTNSGNTNSGSNNQTEEKPLKFQIRVDESDAVVFAKEAPLKNGESTTVNNLINYWAKNNGFDVAKYTFEHYYSSNDNKTYYNADNTVYAGDIITIRMKPVGTNTQTPSDPSATTYTITFYGENNNVLRTATVKQGDLFPSDPMTLAAMEAGSKAGHHFAGWYYNGTNKWFTNDQLSLLPVSGNTTLKVYFAADNTLNSNKLNNYQVYLDIYKDTLVGSPDKRLNITTGIALDDKVTLAEVKSLVMNYYSAKNSYGIGFDGLYHGYGDWVLEYVTDGKINEVNTAGRKSDVVIKVMITNANVKGAATADKSNPKTGDSIYTAMTVLGVSAASLAAVMYFYNKKRYTV